MGRYNQHKQERDVCLESLRPLRYLWLIIGLLIVWWGVSSLLEIHFSITVHLWPFVLIAIGLYIIYHVLSRSRHR
jgi:hypothetical protein